MRRKTIVMLMKALALGEDIGLITDAGVEVDRGVAKAELIISCIPQARISTLVDYGSHRTSLNQRGKEETFNSRV
ncbi:hypothetical protein GOP47_0011162 [Adiantum capillus-veneris]|uniref:Uncharacterized protein n=1 Tax=Adiantum capillus-veneris TaxID=13818 RepID=A0A9D4ZF54_ADICA|nr:hypothetical protein GOP47_0011162 [Adiantum capillus-veneris]